MKNLIEENNYQHLEGGYHDDTEPSNHCRGKSDKKRVKQVIDQPIEIICTNGTMGVDKLDAMIESLYGKQVHILVDSDNEGEKIRKWFKRYLSESHHIRIDKQYCEVAKCPKPYLSRVLEKWI